MPLDAAPRVTRPFILLKDVTNHVTDIFSQRRIQPSEEFYGLMQVVMRVVFLYIPNRS